MSATIRSVEKRDDADWLRLRCALYDDDEAVLRAEIERFFTSNSADDLRSGRADHGDKERAVEMYALASRYPFFANSQWFDDVAGRHIAAVAATLPPEVVAAAEERGRARDVDATVAELLVELGG